MSFDVVLVNIWTVIGFLRWAALALLVVLTFYLINKEKKLWKADLGVVALIFTVLLTPILILEVVWKQSTEDDISYVPNTSIENLTDNPFAGSTNNSGGSNSNYSAPTGNRVPASNAPQDNESESQPESEPEPIPSISSHTISIENASIENESSDGKYEAGSSLKISANNKLGYHFDKWFSDNDVVKDKTDNPLVFTMPDSDIEIYPVYAPNKYNFVIEHPDYVVEGDMNNLLRSLQKSAKITDSLNG